MNRTIIYLINEFLNRAINKSYRRGKIDVVNSIIKHIQNPVKLKDGELPSYLSTDYNSTDEKFINNFKKECFTVACVGAYDLEEKLKSAALKILESPETDKKNKYDAFISEAHSLIAEYVPETDKIPPPGWLKTNLQTAVSSSYNASQWVKIQDPDVKQLYPAYKYKTREDSRVRDEHAILNNSVFQADDPIWKTIYPPNGWNCRCYINYLSNEDIRQPENNAMIVSDAQRNDLIKRARISPDFNRNSGMTGHIFEKWTKSKLKDIPEKVADEISRLAEEYASAVESGGYNIGDSNPKLRVEMNPTQYYDNDMYDSMSYKPFEHYYPFGDRVYTNGNIIHFGVRSFTSQLRKSYHHSHEFYHTYHYVHELIIDNKVDKRLVKLFEKSNDIYQKNKKDIDAVFNFNTRGELIKQIQKEHPQYSIDDVQFLLANTADYINSITRGKSGWGHEISYWNKNNNEYKEWFVHTVEMIKSKNFLQKQYLVNFDEVTDQLNSIIKQINDESKK